MKRPHNASRIRVLVVRAALAVHLFFAAGCGNSSEVSVVAPSTRCAVSVTANTSAVPAAGGNGRLDVDVARECSWGARAEAPWITLSASQGQGPANLTFSVGPNPNGTPRRSAILIENERVEIAQEAAPCGFDVSPSTLEVDAAGGEIAVSVTAPDGCSWSARSNVPWIGNVAPAAGHGSGSVRFTVAGNTGGGRSGTLIVAGVAVTISQAGRDGSPPAPPNPPPNPPPPLPPPPATCGVGISPPSATAPTSGGRVTVAVSAPAGCVWTATSNAAWIKVIDGGTGSGTGEVVLEVSAAGQGSRTGTVTIGGQTFTVNQDSLACTYGIKPNYYNAGRGPDDVRVDVTAPNGCAWSASSPASWATIAEGRSGSGTGTVRLLIDANSGTARSATLTIAGEPFALAQNGCDTRIKPDHYNAGRGPDTIKIEIDAEDDCTWTATSPVSWVAVVEGQTGSGEGTVRLRVDPNDGPARSATLLIGGRAFLLRQQGRE